MKTIEIYRQQKNERGVTLLELIVVLGISGVIFAGLLHQYSTAVTLSYDQSVRVAANLQVQAILQTIGSEIRILGNGVPFDQANFQIGESTLPDPTVTEPIQVSTAAANRLTFRLNETGDVFLLTQDFNPGVSLEIFLTDISDLQANDPIYITNSVMSGDDGFYGIIESVSEASQSVTIADGFQVSPGAVFPMGSILEEVPLVTFNSPEDGTGITRDSGFGAVLMGEGSTMALDYLDQDGNSLALPLTNDMVINQLRSIRVTVSMPAPKRLSNGELYTATAAQRYGIRNLNYVF